MTEKERISNKIVSLKNDIKAIKKSSISFRAKLAAIKYDGMYLRAALMDLALYKSERPKKCYECDNFKRDKSYSTLLGTYIYSDDGKCSVDGGYCIKKSECHLKKDRLYVVINKDLSHEKYYNIEDRIEKQVLKETRNISSKSTDWVPAKPDKSLNSVL